MSEFTVFAKAEAYLKWFFDRKKVVKVLIDGPAVYTTNGRSRKSL